MKILCIHSAPFSFEATEKTKFAENIEAPVVDKAEATNALVVFIATEKPDESATDEIIRRAVEEILKTKESVGAETIVLYPYSHLSSNLASPGKGLEIMRGLRSALEEQPLIACPFGWYKKFSLNGIGHPMSELSRSIDIKGSGAPEKKIMATGREHPVAAMSQKFREAFLSAGLDEMINPAIVDDSHIYKQYGPEAPLILDRVFYIAGLDRADIGLSKEKLAAIRDIAPDFSSEDELKSLLREYKEARIEADDFLEEMALRLKLPGEKAALIIENVFPEFKQLKPTATKKTLRSHMTSNWFPVLQRLRGSAPLPIRLFSVGSRFRREQRQDPHHLFESTSASVVVMDKNLTLDDGKQLVIELTKKMGFKRCVFKKKKIASRYYDPDTDTEVFVKYEGGEIEIGNLGFYSPAALANYGIDVPVFNIGFGVERMAMIMTSARDLRTLVYPQFYDEINFDDEEIAKMLRCGDEPSGELRGAVDGMIEKAVGAASKPGPAEETIFEGEVAGRRLTISIFNWDEGKPLLSMAAMNVVYVHDSNVYGLPEDRTAIQGKFDAIYDDGKTSGLRFIDMIIKGFAADIEKNIAAGNFETLEEKWKMAKRPFQVNLHIPDEAYDYIQGLHKNIKIGGPLFFGLRAEWR